ncbi:MULTISPECIES: ABC transporter family substrate-binding protein [unclassified Streptomyces]|uniref:ABC transporter family substrate-binding protein n=1 Tax=unclassified Streptomyces TaxID=2593676 RepID=UPI0009A06348|nr:MULTISPECIES: ABC transporter family substrate-binding protein [unclassified Streptomyces]MCP3766838.1 ABC transporter substrate-binding protein [Streptomyces sp. MAR25Y5]
MSHDGVGPRAVMRSVAFLTVGALAVPALAGCSSDEDPAGRPLAGGDIARADRAGVADGGTLRWGVDTVPETLNAFQADADTTTTRIAQAVLPSMFRTDGRGRPVRNPDYLESAEVVETEPKQVVLYKLNQQAVWSDGREIGAADFAAQWRALSGKDSAYWTARNAGYDRIEKIERGRNDLEVKVTFGRTYADWRSLFAPLYPKDVMGTPDTFNDGARKKLKVTAGPFRVKKVDREKDEVTLTRNARWWGEPARLSTIVLREVPHGERVAALTAGTLDLAEVDATAARRISVAAGPRGTAPSGSASPGTAASTGGGTDGSGSTSAPDGTAEDGTALTGPGAAGRGAGRAAAKALRSWALANGSDEDEADEEVSTREAAAELARERRALSGFEVRKSLEPAYTQLALNGAEGPLADERVRRAVARALDRRDLAEAVLKPLGLPAEPVGSHLALSGQAAYADGSGALGDQNAEEARALLADAGWAPGTPVKKKGEKAAGGQGEKAGVPEEREDTGEGEGEDADDDGTYIVGEDDDGTNGDDHLAQHTRPKRGSAPGAYAPLGTAAPVQAESVPLAKDGKALTLDFVLPSGPGSEVLATVAGRITEMLKRVGIGTEITKVDDESYFTDHIASGEYDLALYSWPATAFPATDARPVYAKPVPAADGSLNVGQNYTRVGTDQVDQLFDQALATLDDAKRAELIRKADARIWAAAGSIPLYQRPQLTAARKDLANVGAFGFRTPVYEDMGYLKKGVRGPAGTPGKEPTGPSASASPSAPDPEPDRESGSGPDSGRGSDERPDERPDEGPDEGPDAEKDADS